MIKKDMTPINKIASIVVSKGVHYNNETRAQNVWSENYLSFRKPTKKELDSKDFIDLTGRKTGSFTVMGIYYDLNQKHQMWVCRCVCGIYELRRSSSIKSDYNDDKCFKCKHLSKIINKISNRKK